jgi:leader peptidase (prepilin peptidase) / N-methyltransferase
VGTGEASHVATIAVAGVVGILIGSFLNVVIYRVPRGLSIVRPPSHCPVCEAQLQTVDLLPVVSWLVLRARCRHCGAPISARYPTVELATGASFAALAAALGSVAPLPSLAVVTACTLAAAVIDADGLPLPLPLSVVAGVGAASLAPIGAALGHPGRAGWAALGAVLCGLAALATDRSGDAGRSPAVLLLAALGWSAGWLWPGGGPLVAAWLVIAAAATLVSTTRRVPMAVLGVGAFGVVIASAVLVRP